MSCRAKSSVTSNSISEMLQADLIIKPLWDDRYHPLCELKFGYQKILLTGHLKKHPLRKCSPKTLLPATGGWMKKYRLNILYRVGPASYL